MITIIFLILLLRVKTSESWCENKWIQNLVNVKQANKYEKPWMCVKLNKDHEGPYPNKIWIVTTLFLYLK